MTAGAAVSGGGLVVGLLLASGFGRRFDAAGRRNKMLALMPDGRTIVAASARALCATLDHVAVVIPARGTLIEAALSDLPVRLIHNARAKEGIGSSIAVGIAALAADFPEARGWLIALGDMPFLMPATIRAVADAVPPRDASDDHPRIVAATYRAQRGHPVGFSTALTSELVALSGDVGAGSILMRHRVKLTESDDPGALRDIDTRDDLARVA